MVLEIDHDKRRISLGLKANLKLILGQSLLINMDLGDSVEGSIKSVNLILEFL
jgi:ribosomal protein S1